jgi:hypothetical protein
MKPKDYTSLHTVNQVCGYVTTLPKEIATMQIWLRVATLALKAREYPTPSILDDLTGYLELALLLTNRLDVTADRRALLVRAGARGSAD